MVTNKKLNGFCLYQMFKDGYLVGHSFKIPYTKNKKILYKYLFFDSQFQGYQFPQYFDDYKSMALFIDSRL